MAVVVGGVGVSIGGEGFVVLDVPEIMMTLRAAESTAEQGGLASVVAPEASDRVI